MFPQLDFSFERKTPNIEKKATIVKIKWQDNNKEEDSTLSERSYIEYKISQKYIAAALSEMKLELISSHRNKLATLLKKEQNNKK